MAFAIAGCKSGGELTVGEETRPPIALPSGEGTTAPEGTLTETPAPLVSFGLSVTVNGIGNVKSDPAGINCPPDCSKVYDAGTVVKLTATADSLHKFDGWGIVCVGHGACNVTMNSNKIVAADFSEIPSTSSKFRLDVIKSGSGTGTVTSAPAGINCGMDCSEDYDPATGVDLTAVPDAGYTIGAWLPSTCPSGASVCHVDMTSNQTAKVAFEAMMGTPPTVTYNFNVEIIGTGSGRVTVFGHSDCLSGSCAYTGLAAGSYILEAFPDSGSTFTGFSGGGCSSSPCTFGLDSFTSGEVIRVDFTSSSTPPIPVTSATLTINIPDGAGSVKVIRTDTAPVPPPFECTKVAAAPPISCNNTYDSGNQVLLEAVPATGYYFDTWGGDIGTPSANPYGPITLGGPMIIKAVFKPLSGTTLTISPDVIKPKMPPPANRNLFKEPKIPTDLGPGPTY